jgi:uncharacterized membrane protein YeaQ/YmgE (transglycosylase-associated protein family)
VGSWIGLIVFGAVIGVIARLIVPGKQAIGWILTVLLGVLGALAGYWIWGKIAAPGNANTSGIDWIRWLISIAVAVVLTLGYTALTRKKS